MHHSATARADSSPATATGRTNLNEIGR
jgi:hypothetical protein